ncbi:MAG: NADH-quinone oxidoreductase subunit C [Bacteroidia bacterium]|nr:NADH-quinone oxidoreductase subunit C [Bacteroidia bacterium]
MISQAIEDRIINNWGTMAIVQSNHTVLQPWLQLNPEFLLPISFFLRDTPGFYFDFLVCLTGVHYPQSAQMGVVYHLYSIPYNHRITLKVLAPILTEKPPTFPSLCSVWHAAEWHEREAFDLFGIYFENHPDLRRILLPEDWQGHPLRKDYQEPYSYHDIPHL